jgi:hypothetical protein
VTVTLLDLEAGSTAYSSPPNGRMWRFATCLRAPQAQRGQMVTELSGATARKLSVQLRGPASAECVIDGRSPQAALVQELVQDLVVYRFDPAYGGYVILFRGPINRSQDTISETTHTVNVAAADYRAFLARPPVMAKTYAATDQAKIVQDIVMNAWAATIGGAGTDPGIVWHGIRNPDGTAAASDLTGIVRDRTYLGSEHVAEIIDNLADTVNGFEWGVDPVEPSGQPVGGNNQTALVNLYWPQRGVVQPFVAEWGITVASLSRSVNSTDFANWVRLDGTPTGDGSTKAALYSVASGDALANPQLHPEGLWPVLDSNPDVTVQATLDQQAAGELAQLSTVTPAYTLRLVPGAWINPGQWPGVAAGPGSVWLGDTITLRIRSGRLNVNTTVRVLGLDFDIDDSGQERITLTVGRDPVTLASILEDQAQLIDALTRR